MIGIMKKFNMKFRDLNTGKKLYLGFATMILLMILIGGTGIYMFKSVGLKLDEMEQANSPNILYALEMRTASFQVQQWLTDSSATGWEDGFDEAEKWANVFRGNSANLKENLQDLDDVKDVEEADRLFESYYLFGKSMARAYIDEGQEEGNEKMLDFDAYASDIGENMELIQEKQLDKMNAGFENINNERSRFNFAVLAVLIISLILGVVFALFLSRIIVKPLEGLKKVVGQVAEGDLRVEIDEKLIEAKDEIGELASAFNTMIVNLKQLIGNVKTNANSTVIATEQLASSAEEVNASMEQVSSSMQDVAKGAQTVSESSVEAQDASKKTKTSAETGSKLAMDVSSQMGSIGVTTKDGSEKVRALGEKSKEIGKIVETINNISEQTNLLALNAAIEAARAGDAGRGFAVVADEVRKLAEESGNATEQISDLIGGIQKEIEQSVLSMDKTAKEVDGGSEAVQTALKSFEEIPQLVEGVNAALSEMAAVAQQNAAGSEEVSSSVQEVTSSMQQVSSAAQQLSSGADELKDMVSRFKMLDTKEKLVKGVKKLVEESEGKNPGSKGV